MPFRRFLCESPADVGYPFAEWLGFAYVAWAYSIQPNSAIDVVWVRCEHLIYIDDVAYGTSGEEWVTNSILSDADTLEFRRLARLAKCFRGMVESRDDLG